MTLVSAAKGDLRGCLNTLQVLVCVTIQRPIWLTSYSLSRSGKKTLLSQL